MRIKHHLALLIDKLAEAVLASFFVMIIIGAAWAIITVNPIVGGIVVTLATSITWLGYRGKL